MSFDPQTGKPESVAAAGGFDPNTGQPVAAGAPAPVVAAQAGLKY